MCCDGRKEKEIDNLVGISGLEAKIKITIFGFMALNPDKRLIALR